MDTNNVLIIPCYWNGCLDVRGCTLTPMFLVQGGPPLTNGGRDPPIDPHMATPLQT